MALLLVLSLIFPATLQPAKVAILALAIIAVVLLMFSNCAAISLRLYFLSCSYALFGLAWSAYGMVRGNPGALPVMTVMVAYPLIVPLCASIYQDTDGASIYRLLLICTWIIVLTDLVYTLAYSTYAGQLLQTLFDYLYKGDLAAAVNTGTFVKRFRLTNENSLFFFLPFLISSLFFPRPQSGRIHIFIIVILALFLAVITGRRGLFVSMVAGPAIAFALTIGRCHPAARSNRISPWWFLVVGLTTSICLYAAFMWAGLEESTQMLKSITDFSENESNLERVYQYHAMMRGIYENPLFGKGAGAVASYLRSNEQPWTYELSYVALAFQYGLVGLLFYVLGVVGLCWRLILIIGRKGRASFEFYCLAAFIAFVIANATNPYIFEFDSMWMLFLPYAIVNRELVARSGRKVNRVLVGSQLAMS